MLKIGMFFSFKYWIVICFLMLINLKIELEHTSTINTIYNLNKQLF